MNPLLKKLLTPLASLRITVGLLLATMLLVYVGTLAQRTQDNFAVQRQFFHCWFAFMPLNDHFPFLPEAWQLSSRYGYMFLGGYSLIVAILVNLLAAHALRFKVVRGDLLLVPLVALAGWLTWRAQLNPALPLILLTSAVAAAALALTGWLHRKRTGVIVIHFGLILILLGELVTARFAVESQLNLVEGQTQDWVHDIRHPELVVLDTTPADHDAVVAVPHGRIEQSGATVADARLPFEIKVDEYLPNSTLPDRSPGAAAARATAGAGLLMDAVSLRVFTGTGQDSSKVNMPSAYVTLTKGGQPVGTYMVSTGLAKPQAVVVDGKTYGLALRFTRHYKPYSVTLLDFTHEVHQGTDKAKNFAAHVRLKDPAAGVDREVTIRMNQPLRYAGDTLFQSGFDPENPKATTLQVVRNPGWLMPYLACAVGGVGMLIHFVMHLVGFLRKQKKTAAARLAAPLPAESERPQRRGLRPVPVDARGGYTITPRRTFASVTDHLLGHLIPGAGLFRFAISGRNDESTWKGRYGPAIGVGLLAAYYVVAHVLPRDTGGGKFDLAAWGTLPVNFDGREMPLDSVARNALKVISGKETFVLDGKDPVTGKPTETRVQAVKWLADVVSATPATKTYKVIRIDEPQVKGLLGLPVEEKLFSIEQVLPAPVDVAPPPGWEPMDTRGVQPVQGMRQVAAFAVGGGTGRVAAVAVTDMSPQGDLLLANVNRWEQQVGLPPSAAADLPKLLKPVKVAGPNPGQFYDGQLVELSGPGSGGQGPVKMVSVVVSPVARTVAFKMMGAADVVDAQRANFDAFVNTARLNPGIERLQAESERITAKRKANPASLDLYEQKLNELGNHLSLYQRLPAIGELLAVPPLATGEKWRSLGDAAEATKAGQTIPAFDAFVATIRTYRDNQPDAFNTAVAGYKVALATAAPRLENKAEFESFYNRFAPFWVSWGLYIFVFVLTAFSWLGFRKPLARAAMVVLLVSFAVHTFGLVSRIYISGRPPVTNLYSSAVFIAWAAVATCIVLERVFRNGLPMAAAALLGFGSLLVAGGIAFGDAVNRAEGDTMAQLQAVLDTNFWLATHVVMITMGYAAVFLAGVLAIVYVVGGVFTRGFADRDTRKTMSKMVYGVLCFAMLLSFVGTILGGIWADQSWGRFWGWDSKENGAVLIVLWVAVVLHARWGGLARDHGIMSMAILGNIVTAWSWFGTNELGIGLHSYGFTEGVVPRLLLFWTLSLAFSIFA
ncbi:MAG: cytochrome c assembly protein, partial [Phycisphaerales bacterium]|nr:cytochrome c assembly protein [Phycisphaerales bacterium]